MRLLEGLTQQGLSDLSGVSVDTIARLERGEHTPRLDTVQKLARTLEVAQCLDLFPELFTR